jgi:hypothetical protein
VSPSAIWLAVIPACDEIPAEDGARGTGPRAAQDMTTSTKEKSVGNGHACGTCDASASLVRLGWLANLHTSSCASPVEKHYRAFRLVPPLSELEQKRKGARRAIDTVYSVVPDKLLVGGHSSTGNEESHPPFWRILFM